MMPWFPRDALAATLGWSLAEKGLYFCLLFASWELGDLPASTDELARIAGATPDEFREVWPRVAPKFEAIASGRLINRRLESHRAKSLKIRDVRAQAGHAGGVVSGARRQANASANGEANAQASAQQPSSKEASKEPSKIEAPSPSPSSLKNQNSVPPERLLPQGSKADARPTPRRINFKNGQLAEGKRVTDPESDRLERALTLWRQDSSWPVEKLATTFGLDVSVVREAVAAERAL